MLHTISSLVLAVLVGLVCVGCGRVLLARMQLSTGSANEDLVLAGGTGAGVMVYALVALGALRLFTPPIAWALLAGLAAAAWQGVRSLLTFRRAPRPRETRGRWGNVALRLLLGAYLLAYTAVALTPTLEGDSIAGYLLTAREYARLGGIVSIDYAYTNSYPANGQMLSTLGFLLDGQILAQLLVVWLPGLLALGAVYAFGAAWVSPQAAAFALPVWYGTYAVGYLAASGKIDLVWAAFDLLALLAFARWYFSAAAGRRRRWLVLAGAFIGLAGGTKQASAFTALALGIAVTVRIWRDRRPIREWIQASLALAVPAAAAGLWAVRSFLISGSPGVTGVGFRGAAGPGGFAATLWEMSMLGSAVSVEGPLGKSIGPTLLATIPLIVLLRRIDRRAWDLLAFCGLMLVLWFQGVQRARHLLPTLAILAILSGYVVHILRRERPWLGRLIMVLVVTALVANLARWSYINFAAIQRVPYLIGRHDLDGFLAANLPKMRSYPNAAIVVYARTHLPATSRIAAASTGNGFYLERPFYTTWMQTPREVPDGSAFAAQLSAAGITHVFINDYAVAVRDLGASWLAQREFQQRFLRPLLCRAGQCLYEFHGEYAARAGSSDRPVRPSRK